MVAVSELTKKQQKALDDLEVLIAAKRSQWLTAYNSAKAVSGLAVRMDSPELTILYTELVNLRNQRNSLLATYRANGVNI